MKRRQARGKARIGVLLGLGVALLASGGCRPGSGVVDDARLLRKIGFNLTALNADGLIGPPDGRRALDYEFCIPAGPRFESAVRSIDTTLRLMPGVPGRIGCGAGQVLCIGNTHQPHFREVLLKLARLEYVERIEETVWE